MFIVLLSLHLDCTLLPPLTLKFIIGATRAVYVKYCAVFMNWLFNASSFVLLEGLFFPSMAAIYPAPIYTTPVQTVPVDNDINNTTVSLSICSKYFWLLIYPDINFLRNNRFLLVIWTLMSLKKN